jgi:transposase-like protein
MAQHFLLSAQARTLSLAKVMRMSDDEAFEMFKSLRWPEGVYCAECGCVDVYQFKTRRIFKCSACKRQFSATSGTLFASRKLPLRDYLAAIAIFVNGAKGYSALQLSRDLDVQYRTAYVLAHKLREAMASEQRGIMLDGEIEVDGAFFGGHVQQKNRKKDRIDRRKAIHQTGKRRSVVVARERGGNAVTGVFRSERKSTDFVISHIKDGSVVYTDESLQWEPIRDYFLTYSIDHRFAYAEGDICTNQAESYFSRLRRAEMGQHHSIAGPYLDRYAAEMAWRENQRRSSNGRQFARLTALCASLQPSQTWRGYWQKHTTA